jgi:hypothetical protein
VTDIYSQLARLSFRQIVVPVSARSVRFEHETVEHKLSFKDNELIEQLGSKNWTFDYTIPFREGITTGPYRNLFLDTMARFIQAMRDREPGPLVDPILGPFTVVPVRFSAASDVNRRDGDDVQVTFRHAPEPGEEDDLSKALAGVEGASADGKRLDDEAARITDDQIEAAGLIPEEFEPELGDTLDQASGIVEGGIASANMIDAGFQKMSHKLDKFESALTEIDKVAGDPGNAPVIRGARRLRDSANRLQTKALFPGSEIASYVVPENIALGPLAQSLGMSIGEFITLNPFVGGPVVPKNTVVNYLKSVTNF